MPNQRAEGLEGYRLDLDGELKAKFLAICKELDLSGNQVINRFVKAVIASGNRRKQPAIVKVSLAAGAGSPARPPS